MIKNTTTFVQSAKTKADMRGSYPTITVDGKPLQVYINEMGGLFNLSYTGLMKKDLTVDNVSETKVTANTNFNTLAWEIFADFQDTIQYPNDYVEFSRIVYHIEVLFKQLLTDGQLVKVIKPLVKVYMFLFAMQIEFGSFPGTFYQLYDTSKAANIGFDYEMMGEMLVVPDSISSDETAFWSTADTRIKSIKKLNQSLPVKMDEPVHVRNDAGSRLSRYNNTLYRIEQGMTDFMFTVPVSEIGDFSKPLTSIYTLLQHSNPLKVAVLGNRPSSNRYIFDLQVVDGHECFTQPFGTVDRELIVEDASFRYVDGKRKLNDWTGIQNELNTAFNNQQLFDHRYMYVELTDGKSNRVYVSLSVTQRYADDNRIGYLNHFQGYDYDDSIYSHLAFGYMTLESKNTYPSVELVESMGEKGLEYETLVENEVIYTHMEFIPYDSVFKNAHDTFVTSYLQMVVAENLPVQGYVDWINNYTKMDTVDTYIIDNYMRDQRSKLISTAGSVVNFFTEKVSRLLTSKDGNNPRSIDEPLPEMPELEKILLPYYEGAISHMELTVKEGFELISELEVNDPMIDDVVERIGMASQMLTDVSLEAMSEQIVADLQNSIDDHLSVIDLSDLNSADIMNIVDSKADEIKSGILGQAEQLGGTAQIQFRAFEASLQDKLSRVKNDAVQVFEERSEQADGLITVASLRIRNMHESFMSMQNSTLDTLTGLFKPRNESQPYSEFNYGEYTGTDGYSAAWNKAKDGAEFAADQAKTVWRMTKLVAAKAVNWALDGIKAVTSMAFTDGSSITMAKNGLSTLDMPATTQIISYDDWKSSGIIPGAVAFPELHASWENGNYSQMQLIMIGNFYVTIKMVAAKERVELALYPRLREELLPEVDGAYNDWHYYTTILDSVFMAQVELNELFKIHWSALSTLFVGSTISKPLQIKLINVDYYKNKFLDMMENKKKKEKSKVAKVIIGTTLVGAAALFSFFTFGLGTPLLAGAVAVTGAAVVAAQAKSLSELRDESADLLFNDSIRANDLIKNSDFQEIWTVGFNPNHLMALYEVICTLSINGMVHGGSGLNFAEDESSLGFIPSYQLSNVPKFKYHLVTDSEVIKRQLLAFAGIVGAVTTATFAVWKINRTLTAKKRLAHEQVIQKSFRQPDAFLADGSPNPNYNKQLKAAVKGQKQSNKRMKRINKASGANVSGGFSILSSFDGFNDDMSNEEMIFLIARSLDTDLLSED